MFATRNLVNIHHHTVTIFFLVMRTFKIHSWDFPGGAVVGNPPANAGDTRFKPWSGKIPHAAEQLSLCATTTEPVL